MGVVRDRPVVVAFGLVGGAPIVEGVGEVRFEADRLVVVGDRPVVVAHLVVNEPAIVEHGGVVRFEADRLVVIGDRPVVVSLHVISESAVVESEGAIAVCGPAARQNGRASGDLLVPVLNALLARVPILIGRDHGRSEADERRQSQTCKA